ncbi:MAG: MBL fold metallo-hydrolase [Dehalococcoidales bacterium]|nr:MBL fold metallo-hydrolase [Dehalococcoidales bacterium]
MSAVRQAGRINDITVLIDTGMDGIAGGTAAYLIEGDKKCLIDSGPRNKARDLFNTLKKLGAFPPDIVIVTHSHYDHSQGIPFLRRAAAKEGKNIQVLASPHGVPLLADQSWNNIFNAGYCEGIPEVTSVKEGDIIDLGKTSLRVYEIPGHCKDHIAILDEKNKNLFVGDAIGNIFGDNTFFPPFMPPFWDPVAYRSSLDKLKGIDFDTLCIAHFGCFSGNEARTILDKGLRIYEGWWALFEHNKAKLADIHYMAKTVLAETRLDIPDMKIISPVLRLLFAIITGWRKLTHQEYRSTGMLLLHIMITKLAIGYQVYQKEIQPD